MLSIHPPNPNDQSLTDGLIVSAHQNLPSPVLVQLEVGKGPETDCVLVGFVFVVEKERRGWTFLFTGGGSGGPRPANDEDDNVNKSCFLAARI
jgi:hypothetical protein